MAVVMMTAYGEVETAVKAIRAGAQDVIIKPFNIEQLMLSVERVLGNTRAARRLYTSHRRGQFFHVTPGIVMSSAPSMQDIYETVRRLAAGDATTVLIEGESGVGKDVLANLIHASSTRSDEAFLELNCGALPEKLLESELFGHEKGSFTGAVQAKMGLLELAHKGSLCLDEIGEMSLSLQVKLLRVLEKQSFRRVGGDPGRAAAAGGEGQVALVKLVAVAEQHRPLHDVPDLAHVAGPRVGLQGGAGRRGEAGEVLGEL
jgi:two-component system response regulator AtoC